MRTVLIAAAAAAATVAALSTPASADRGRRVWRGPAIGAISHNVITPWYVGYYPGHYSYYKPDPIYYRVYFAEPGCWRWIYGHRAWVC